MVSDKKIFMGISHNFDKIVIGWFFSNNASSSSALRPRWLPQPNLASHRTIREIHIKIFSSETTGLIPTKANGFRQEDFYGNFPYGPMLN
jgi:hypothetical protein